MPPADPAAIDVHVHLTRYWRDLERTAYRTPIDYTVRGLLAEMDDAGISDALAIPVHHVPSAAAGIEEETELVRASGGRLHAVATVDPTQGAYAVEEAVAAWDAVADLAAIKLFPGYQAFYPSDPRLAPVYALARRRKIPVLIHQGDTLEPRGLLKFARPLAVDEVAVEHPDVAIVLCHFGNPWIEEAAEIVYKNANVYADTSGLFGPPSAPLYPRLLKSLGRRITEAIESIGHADRILYGSDWPLGSLRAAVDFVRSLDLSEADRRAILGANARRLFGWPARSGERNTP